MCAHIGLLYAHTEARCLPLFLFALFAWDGVSHCTSSSLFQIGLHANEFLRSTKVKATRAYALFKWALGGLNLTPPTWLTKCSYPFTSLMNCVLTGKCCLTVGPAVGPCHPEVCYIINRGTRHCLSSLVFHVFSLSFQNISMFTCTYVDSH